MFSLRDCPFLIDFHPHGLSLHVFLMRLFLFEVILSTLMAFANILFFVRWSLVELMSTLMVLSNILFFVR